MATKQTFRTPKRGGCRKIGCGGCLMLLGLLFLGAIVVGWSAFQGGGAEPAEQKREQRSVPLGSDLERVESERPLGELPAAGILRLDLSYGQFVVVPGEPGEPLKIEADYDQANYELTENIDGTGSTWRGEIEFGRRRGWWSSISADARNRVKIILPPDVPFEIEARIRMGESELDLGGLSLQRGEFEFGMGDHEVFFSRPLPQPVDKLTVDASMGAVRLLQIGNASPAEFRAQHSMGDLEIDLRGDWRNSCEVTAQQTMGALSLRASSDVRVLLSDTSVFMGGKDIRLGSGSQLESDLALSLDLSVTMGELRVRP